MADAVGAAGEEGKFVGGALGVDTEFEGGGTAVDYEDEVGGCGGFGMVWPFCCVFVRADGLEICDLFGVEVLRCAQDDSGWWWVVGRIG